MATTRAARFPGKYGPTQQMGRKYSWHRFPVKTGKAKNIPTTFFHIYSIFQYPNPARICEFDRIPIFPPLPPPLYARGFPSPLIPDISIFGFCIAAEVEEAIEFLPAILYGKLDDRINIFLPKKTKQSTLLRVVSFPRIISSFLGISVLESTREKGKREEGGLLLNTDQFLCPQAVPERERGGSRGLSIFPLILFGDRV